MTSRGSSRAGSRSARAAVAVALLVGVACTPSGDDGAAAPLNEDGRGEVGDAEVGGAQEEQDGQEDAGEQEEEAPSLHLVEDDVLTVCVEPAYPPFVEADPDSELGYGGFDVELIGAVAETVGIPSIAVVEATFEDIASGAALADGPCDVGASAIPITSGRAERVAFTEPYYVSRRALLVPGDSELEQLGDLERGMVLGVQRGTSAADRAMEDVEDAEIRTFDDGDQLYQAVVDAEVDAVLHDLAVARLWSEHNGELRVVEEFRRVEEYGFAVALERDDDLLAVLDAGLQQLRADGTYEELFASFFMADD